VSQSYQTAGDRDGGGGVGAGAPNEVRQLRFERPPGATTILLIRHGESIPAREDAPFDLVGGQGDPELDPRGREQAELIAERLASSSDGKAISAIYVSNLRRTAETAAPLARRLGLQPVVEADLREVHLGEWEGGLYRIRILENGPIAQKLMTEGRWDVIPGAEPDVEFTARVVASINRIADAHPDQTVAVFTHGGVIGRAIVEASGARPLTFTGADNGSMSEIVVAGGRWMVRKYNDTAHLEDRTAD
jgi:2,3-bisphosphoglycerate-dependent phosphoglycerate mutase